MIELLCAIVVLNLLVAGFANMYQGQNKLVNSLEEWSEGDPVYYVVPNSREMARALGVPAILAKKPSSQKFSSQGASPYEVEVLEMKRRFSKSEASAVFSHEKKEDSEKKRDTKKEKSSNKGDRDEKDSKKERKGKKDRGSKS